MGKWLSIQVEVDPRCLLFFFKKNGMLNSRKESESQSERDVPNGRLQIDDIKPTVDGRNPAVKLLGRVIINKFDKSWIMFG